MYYNNLRSAHPEQIKWTYSISFIPKDKFLIIRESFYYYSHPLEYFYFVYFAFCLSGKQLVLILLKHKFFIKHKFKNLNIKANIGYIIRISISGLYFILAFWSI